MRFRARRWAMRRISWIDQRTRSGREVGAVARCRSLSLDATAAAGMRSDIESWAKKQNDMPSRSEAIRRLIKFALAVPR